MSALLDDLDQRIGGATVERALNRLGTTPHEFSAMSGAEFSVLLERYAAECAAYVARLRARDDQVQAAARLSQSVPDDCRQTPLWELTQRGILDQGEFIAGMQTLVRVQAEDEADPNPADESVTALLDALAAAMGGDVG